MSALAAAERDQMWDLYRRNYDGTTRVRFDEDLADKQQAILVRDPDGAIQGFSTLKVWTTAFEGRDIRVVFSGDTIIDPAHWGSQALAFAWLRRAGELRREQPHLPLFWFLIVKGPRTYRYLPTFAREYHPSRDAENPMLARLAAELATHRYGSQYDPAGGLVRFADSHGHLNGTLAWVSDREARRPDVAYFLSRNPRYMLGDELVCVCELADGNLRPIAQRAFRSKAPG